MTKNIKSDKETAVKKEAVEKKTQPFKKRKR